MTDLLEMLGKILAGFLILLFVAGICAWIAPWTFLAVMIAALAVSTIILTLVALRIPLRLMGGILVVTPEFVARPLFLLTVVFLAVLLIAMAELLGVLPDIRPAW
jgi:hypothetical protein